MLSELGYDFKTAQLEVDESHPDTLEPSMIAEFLATKKNNEYRKHYEDAIIVTADTTVIFGVDILEKPGSEQEATEMISALSGRRHSVVTGFCVSNSERSISDADMTEVLFKELSQKEILEYVSRFKPLDKAGAYGIQEWIGLIGVEEIKGSYFNVMGLPTHRIYQVLTSDFNLFPF